MIQTNWYFSLCPLNGGLFIFYRLLISGFRVRVPGESPENRKGKNAVIPDARRRWRAFDWVQRPHEGMIFERPVSHLKTARGKNAVIPDARQSVGGFLIGFSAPIRG
jgi:hypothetical protein